MTNWGFDDGQTDGQGNNNIDSPGGLRQFAEKTQQENKALKDQLEQIQKTLQTNSVQSVFNDLGVPGAASQYTGDADPAKIKTWVENQRTIFGGTTQGTPSETPQVQVVTDALPAQTQQQLESFNNAGQSGTPMGSFEQAHANLNDATNLQGLIDAMNFSR